MEIDTILSAIVDTNPEHREIYREGIKILLKQLSLANTPRILTKPMRLNHLSFNYSAVDAMAFQLALQLEAYERRGFTILFWQPQDILVVNLEGGITLYLLASLKQRVSLNKKDETQLIFVYPMVFPLPVERCAPELLNITALPFITNRSASYYSLALLCLHVVNLSLDKLKGTKLFYFLERCLKEDPSERMLLYLF